MLDVTLIGAGGVGTRLLSLAFRMFDFNVMDGDGFEKKNLDRQLVARKFIGENKAIAMGKMYSHIRSIPFMLTETAQLEGSEFVVAVPDNHMARLIALSAADEFGFPLILAGNEEYTANAMYYDNRFMGTSVDPRVRYPDMMEGAGREAGEACATRIVTKPQTGLANSMAADFALALLIYWTTNAPSEHLIRDHAPFEFIWDKSSVKTIKGYES